MTTTDNKTAPNSRNGKSSSGTSVGSDALTGIGRAAVNILTVPARLIQFLTTPPGSSIMLGLGVMYFAAVSVEGYWQAMNSANPAFVPKPFIPDGANPILFIAAITKPTFWMATILSLIVQGVQAFVLREVEIEKAKAQYDAVKDYRVPDAVDNQLDIAEYRRQRFKSIGMRTIRTRGFLIFLTYAIDFSIAFWNFPLLAQTAGKILINLVWIVASVFGTEAMINLFMNAIYPVKPQVEIIP